MTVTADIRELIALYGSVFCSSVVKSILNLILSHPSYNYSVLNEISKIANPKSERIKLQIMLLNHESVTNSDLYYLIRNAEIINISYAAEDKLVKRRSAGKDCLLSLLVSTSKVEIAQEIAIDLLSRFEIRNDEFRWILQYLKFEQVSNTIFSSWKDYSNTDLVQLATRGIFKSISKRSLVLLVNVIEAGEHSLIQVAKSNANHSIPEIAFSNLLKNGKLSIDQLLDIAVNAARESVRKKAIKAILESKNQIKFEHSSTLYSVIRSNRKLRVTRKLIELLINVSGENAIGYIRTLMTNSENQHTVSVNQNFVLNYNKSKSNQDSHTKEDLKFLARRGISKSIRVRALNILIRLDDRTFGDLLEIAQDGDRCDSAKISFEYILKDKLTTRENLIKIIESSAFPKSHSEILNRLFP